MRMTKRLYSAAALLGAVLAGAASAQDAHRMGPVAGATYIELGRRDADAILYEPADGARLSVALVYIHPNGNTFQEPPGPELAKRGYRIAMVNYHGVAIDGVDDVFAPAIAQTIRYVRSLPGVRKIVLIGHSGGGHLTTFYADAAEHGAAHCADTRKIYPCRADLVQNLARIDGLILLDPTLGTFHQANAIDPAETARGRDARLDMVAAINGYESRNGLARYSPVFVKRFDAAQAARNSALTATALARLKLIDAGKGRFKGDEPFVIPGMGNLAAGARLYQPDPTLLAHTRGRYRTLMADGTVVESPIRSIRPPMGRDMPGAIGTLATMTRVTTIRQYLSAAAIRFTPPFAITADNILGVDWRSGMSSTPGSAEGVPVPSLVVTMTCHYLVVPGEIVFDHLAAHDKTLIGIEGASHVFTPCKPEYGDTTKRTFDAVADWLGSGDRF